MRLINASDSSVLVAFGDGQDDRHEREVTKLLAALQLRSDPRIRNLHPAYSSLLIDFDPLHLTTVELAGIVEAAMQVDSADQAMGKRVELPVAYGGEAGPDLDFVAQHCGVSPDEIVRRHASGEYQVAFVGFMPGFAYLSGLPHGLAVPRRATPRKLVPAGSVAIAGGQTGVYPLDSPGGWQLIGRTTVRLFDSGRQQPSLLETGDIVRFVPIEEATPQRIVPKERP